MLTECPLLAQSGHRADWDGTTAFDPKRTSVGVMAIRKPLAALIRSRKDIPASLVFFRFLGKDRNIPL